MSYRTNKIIQKSILGIVIIGVLWLVIKSSALGIGAFTPANIRDYVTGYGNMAPIIYLIVYLVNTIIAFPPIIFISVSAGVIFGKLYGAILLMIASMIGISITFFMSRYFFGGVAKKVVKGKGKILAEALKEKGFITVLLFRTVPIIPYEVMNYACGLTSITFRDYFWATFIGFIPGTIITVCIGDSVAGVYDLRDIVSMKVIIPLFCFLLLILIAVIYKKVKKNI